jgi:hypothetical protein
MGRELSRPIYTDLVEVIYFLATALLAASTISSVSK